MAHNIECTLNQWKLNSQLDRPFIRKAVRLNVACKADFALILWELTTSCLQN